MIGATGVIAGATAARQIGPFHAGDRNQGTPPNVLFFLADDMRFDSLGISGNRVVRTPVLDRLAETSALFFNNFVTTAICPVSRASIMTGQYARRHGIQGFETPLTKLQLRETYHGRLRPSHFTGFIGKWGVGANVPLPSGEFDYWDGFDGQGRYLDTTKPDQPHLTQRQTQSALTFLDKSARERRPFCLSVSFKAPHAQDGEAVEFPYESDLADYYKDVTIPFPATATTAAFMKQPRFLQQSESRRRWELRFSNFQKAQETVKDIYRLVSGIDRAVGRILDALDKSGRLDDTLIIFSSDNGFFFGEHGLADKWWMFEESIRVPLLIRPPRRLGAARGQIVTELSLNIDICPTILAACWVEPGTLVQGSNLLTLLDRTGTATWRSDFYYEHFLVNPTIPTSEGVRGREWKYH